MKYSEAKKKIKALSSKYDIDMSDGDFNVIYKGRQYDSFSVNGSCQYLIYISSNENFKKLPFSNKLYMIMAELAMTPLDERVEEKKQYVKVFDKSLGYLNIDNGVHNQLDKLGKPFIDNKAEFDGAITKFTDRDIEDLKKRNDIPLDWKKVHFEDAE